MRLPDQLTQTELAEATGKQKPAQQAAVLAKRGVPFVFSPSRVRVDRAIALAHELLARHDGASGIKWGEVR